MNKDSLFKKQNWCIIRISFLLSLFSLDPGLVSWFFSVAPLSSALLYNHVFDVVLNTDHMLGLSQWLLSFLWTSYELSFTALISVPLITVPAQKAPRQLKLTEVTTDWASLIWKSANSFECRHDTAHGKFTPDFMWCIIVKMLPFKNVGHVYKVHKKSMNFLFHECSDRIPKISHYVCENSPKWNRSLKPETSLSQAFWIRDTQLVHCKPNMRCWVFLGACGKVDF